ncbi:MAG: transposase [Bacteroidetes bacterium]|jgi:hypothetical protein|nr:transposase [Bacteroidota bacterium]
MLPEPLLSAALTSIFAKMAAFCNPGSVPGTWQERFLHIAFAVMLRLRGRVTFTNLARFAPIHEQTFRRQFAKTFDWIAFNLAVLRLRRHPRERLIGVFDCSFLPKSGEATYGLGSFFCAASQRAERGLEVSLLGIVATESRRAFGLDAMQTPPEDTLPEGTTRMDAYAGQVTACAARLDAADLGICYWVADGGYARTKIFNAVRRAGGHFITRLRSDAHLRYLYTGERKAGPGRPKQYDGKIRWEAVQADPHEQLTRFDEVAPLAGHPQIRVLTTVANSPNLRRTVRIVVLLGPDLAIQAILCSTDTEQPAEQIVRYYRLRYQIEFLIRDAKQHAGLTHSQARSREKLDFHLNLSMATVNVLRWLAVKAGCSPRTYRRVAYNRLIIARLLSALGLSAEYEANDPRIEVVAQTGRLAA